jgi:uncharacterized membrane protein
MEIIMKTLQNTYSSSTVKINITITNNTFIEYSTDMNYSIEYYNGSTWVKIPLEFCIDDVMIFLHPQESKEFNIYLYPDQYYYQPGKYRICKTVSSNDGIYKLTSPFNIQ